MLLYKVISSCQRTVPVTQLHVSDHPSPIPNREQEGETSWMRSFGRRTAKCRNMLPLMTPDIVCIWHLKMYALFWNLESQLSGVMLHTCTFTGGAIRECTYSHSPYRVGKVPRWLLHFPEHWKRSEFWFLGNFLVTPTFLNITQGSHWRGWLEGVQREIRQPLYLMRVVDWNTFTFQGLGF